MGDGDKAAIGSRRRLRVGSFPVAFWRPGAAGINSLSDTRILLDRAILTHEKTHIQDEVVRKARVALESLFVLPDVGKGKR